MKEKYISPAILEECILELEREILQGSAEIEDSIDSVQTAGQEVVEIDCSAWTQEWQ